MVVLDSKKDSVIKVPLTLWFQSSTKIVCLTLSPNGVMVVDLLCLLVLGVEESIMVNA